MYVVCVTFEIAPESMSSFLPLMKLQAANSLQNEAGCHHFDVCLDEERSVIFLYEVYANRAAFDAHLQTPHFLEFDAASRDLIVSKDIATYVKL